MLKREESKTRPDRRKEQYNEKKVKATSLFQLKLTRKSRVRVEGQMPREKRYLLLMSLSKMAIC